MTSPTPTRQVASITRELSDFLVEFSIVLHKRAMYPAGHPLLRESTERVIRGLEALLTFRETLVVGVARNQLILGGAATDPRNALLGDLARRLHRHRIASLSFGRGTTVGEVDELLGWLTADPSGEAGPLGLHADRTASWRHLQVQPPELDRLHFDEHEAPGNASPEGGLLWLKLANLALAGDGGTTEEGRDPLVVARAIDVQAGNTQYDRVVLDYLAQMGEELSGGAGAWEPQMRERVSRLVAALQPRTLRRLLASGGDHAQRRRFVLTASESLAADAVLEVLEAAAATSGQSISNQLLRLLHKLARHADHGDGAVRSEVAAVLQQNVARLVADWNLDDPNPGTYTAVLDGMAGASRDSSSREVEPAACGAETILQMALETDALGPAVFAAVNQMLTARHMPRLRGILAAAPASAAAEQVWRHVASPARLREAIDASPMDTGTVEALATRLGPGAVGPLLDLLQSAEHRSSRAFAIKVLTQIGPAAVGPAAARLTSSPWYVQRNLLVLLRALKAPPEALSADSFALHADARVRIEAYRLLLDSPPDRRSAITRALADSDDGIVHLALRAGLAGCPGTAQAALQRLIANASRPPDLRALAIRILSDLQGAEVIPHLLDLAGRRRFLRWTVGAKTPVALAALAAIARHGSGHKQAAVLLRLAQRHRDAEIRLAAQAECP